MMNIEITESGGMQCDNPKCGWKDRTIPAEKTHEYLNKPCPDCGENLLTQEDLDNFNQFMEAVNIINLLTPEQLEKFVANMPPEQQELVGIHSATIEFHKKIKITPIKGDWEEAQNPF